MRLKLLALLFSGVMLLGLVEIGNATILTFDDVTSSYYSWIPNGYGGFNWDNFAVVSDGFVPPGSGYVQGTVSGNYTAYNYKTL